LEEGAQLVEEHVRKRPVTAQPLDADESLENGLCLLHRSDGSHGQVTEARPLRAGCVPVLDGCAQRALRLEPEELAVEAADELRAVSSP